MIQTYTVKAWTKSPNSVAELTNFNDTFTKVAKPALSGIYTIGGSNPDFNTFTDAIDAMKSGGILDSVLFKVRNGTYSEHLEIPSIIGANTPNSICFESENKDSSLVILSYLTSYSFYEVIHIDGASNVSFKHITIKSLNTSSPSRAVTIDNGASQIQFSNNKFESSNISSTSTYYDALVYLDYQETKLSFTNNHF
ncbi:MAG: hypothetical protein R2852_04545 [Bacteroidia bacterium]